MSDDKVNFLSAKPVWPEGREIEKNLTVGFMAIIEKPQSGETILRIAGATIYRCFLNGEFTGHGPARGPHGYFRVDEWSLTNKLKPGKNIIAVEIAGYNINSYYIIDQPSFIQAEVVSSGKVLAATSDIDKSFEAIILTGRIQKVQKYSFQRAFVEAYRLMPGNDRWQYDISAVIQPVKCSAVLSKEFIPRRVSIPDFALRYPSVILSKGAVERGRPPAQYWKDRSYLEISDKLKGYKLEELETVLSNYVQEIFVSSMKDVNRQYIKSDIIKLRDKDFLILDFGLDLTGFIGIKVKCSKDTRLLLVFDETLTGKDVAFIRQGCLDVVSYELKAGEYKLETIEPYTMRYLKLIVMSGECDVEQVYLREYVNPDVNRAEFKSDRDALNKIFEAGRETFRQNAVDIYMDCPSRERAGWLCDSFFTSRVEYCLTGKSKIEKTFFENYLLPEIFKCLPDGMLPMCYPSDHYDGVFIPNWAMWFVVELEEYLLRSGDKELVNALKPKIMKLFDYFKKFKNEDGLLEKLQGWVFLEWSKANEFTQDVNYPTNMLYAGALSAAGRMYNDDALIKEAENIQDTIRKQSFNGEFFVDNAIRENGKLIVTKNTSEVCQYYAFFFETAKPETHKELFNILTDKFGPERKNKGYYPGVHTANAFIGNYLRLEILSRYGYVKQMLEEFTGYFLHMAIRTGTLWENEIGEVGSFNHGFASHVVQCLYRDALGMYNIDSQKKIVKLRFCDIELKQCEGKIPVGDGILSIKWWKDNDSICYNVNLPEGYVLEVKNLTGKKAIVS